MKRIINAAIKFLSGDFTERDERNVWYYSPEEYELFTILIAEAQSH